MAVYEDARPEIGQVVGPGGHRFKESAAGD